MVNCCRFYVLRGSASEFTSQSERLDLPFRPNESGVATLEVVLKIDHWLS